MPCNVWIDHRPHTPSPEEEARRLDEANKLKTELKAETGYYSYGEYLNENWEKCRGCTWLVGHLRRPYPTLAHLESYCIVYELSRGLESRVNVNVRCRTSYGVEILTTLRKPLASSSVQIVLWSVGGFGSDLISAFGLGLKIEATFFQAIYQKIVRLESDSAKDPSRPLVPAHAEIGGNLITVASCDRPVQAPAIPIVLIAGNNWTAGKFSDSLPLLDSNADGVSHGYMDQSQISHFKDEVSGYARALVWCLGNGDTLTSTICSSSLVFSALLPLVYESTFLINDRCVKIRSKYLKLLNDSSSSSG